MKLSDFEQPSVTTDLVIFTIKENSLKVLLVKRNVEPFKDKWALPGGFVRIDESLEDSAKRELFEETGVKNVYLEQLYSFGNPKRDPRGRVITISYFALINSEKVKLKASTDVSEAKLFSVSKIPLLAFDHKEILEYAIKRLKWKFEYTTIAFSLLPKKFSLGELQKIYEIVFEKKIDKRNFRKKILSLGILKKESIKKDAPHRPPQLYSLKNKIGEIINIL
ncbi:MAG: NUDIX domain-containing protein [Nanoarchaeota archaeon]|nr:NUDIX domain-containing protein [Nanoarchaeota archaeon]